MDPVSIEARMFLMQDLFDAIRKQLEEYRRLFLIWSEQGNATLFSFFEIRTVHPIAFCE